MTAKTVTNILVRAWIKRYGCPREIHSDQGRQYESSLFQEVCKLLVIQKCRTTPVHPRSDGMIERMNRTVQDMLSKYIKGHQQDWDDYLDFITMAYNTTSHESTGVTPHRMVYGEEMNFPLDVQTEQLQDQDAATHFKCSG
jgi:transposase InsO family protein